MYVSDKSNLTTGGSMSEVLLRYVPMRNHHDILMFFGENSRKTRLNSPGGDNDIPDIMSDMLTRS